MRGPTVRLRRLGNQLRALRKGRALTVDDVVRHTGVSAGSLSRMENGASRPKPTDLDGLLDLYGVADGERRGALHALARDGGKRGWWQTYAEQITHDYADLISLEDDALSIRTYETTLVPGLLQTGAYARATLTSLAMSPRPDLTEARVAVRQARQAVLTRPRPLEIHAVVHEAAVRHRVGTPHVMRDQLQRLVDWSALPNVELQVLPLASPATPALAGGFSVIGWGDPALDVVLLENLTNALYVEDTAEVRNYAWAFDQITSAALPSRESVDLIVALKDGIS